MLVGLEQLLADPDRWIGNERVGIVTHPAALAKTPAGRYVSALDALADVLGKRLEVVFGPEHGLTGEAQDLIPVQQQRSPRWYRTISLYGETFASLKPTAEQLAGLDLLMIDMQDVGSRYYTFQATMLFCLEACAQANIRVLVLDRPNPLGGTIVEGPTIQPGFDSFVGPHPIATRHGMTMGELASLYVAERNISVQLQVIPCQGWDRQSHGFQGRLFYPPSPNMPSLETVQVYPGMCLIEGTNLSEGRGTTRPFEWIGHPAIAPERLVDLLHQQQIPGCQFLPVRFQPTFHKFAGLSCGGIFLHPALDFQSVRTGLAILWAFKCLLGEQFQWRTARYEFVDHIPAIDLLLGSDRERRALNSGAHWRELSADWIAEEADFQARRARFLSC